MCLARELRLMVYRHLFQTSGTLRLEEQLPASRSCHSSWKPSECVNDEDRDYQDDVLEATLFLRWTGQLRELAALMEPEYQPITSTAAILATCRVIYHEAVPIFYAESPIHFSIRSHLQLEMNSLQPWLLSIKHLSVDFS